MEITPIPDGQTVKTVYGEGKVVKSFRRETHLSPFKVVCEYQYDVQIKDRVLRVFNTEIDGAEKKTLHHRETRYKFQNPEQPKKEKPISNRLADVQRRADNAYEYWLAGNTLTQSCKKAGIDHRSLYRRYPDLEKRK